MALFLTNLILKNHKLIKKEKPTSSCRLFRVVISLKYKRAVENLIVFSRSFYLGQYSQQNRLKFRLLIEFSGVTFNHDKGKCGQNKD